MFYIKTSKYIVLYYIILYIVPFTVYAVISLHLLMITLFLHTVYQVLINYENNKKCFSCIQLMRYSGHSTILLLRLIDLILCLHCKHVMFKEIKR